MLDPACGNGPLLKLLVAPGRDVVGLDMADGELAAARRRPTLAATPLVRAMAQDLPLRADAFDAARSLGWRRDRSQLAGHGVRFRRRGAERDPGARHGDAVGQRQHRVDRHGPHLRQVLGHRGHP